MEMEKQNFIEEGLDKKHISPRDILPDSGKKKNKSESEKTKIKEKYPYPGDPNKKQGYTHEEIPVIVEHHEKVAAVENARKNQEDNKHPSTEEKMRFKAQNVKSK